MNRNANNMLNIYVPENSTSLKSLLVNNTYSLVGKNCSWTNDMSANNRYYNATYNIYIYPVSDVSMTKEANGD